MTAASEALPVAQEAVILLSAWHVEWHDQYAALSECDHPRCKRAARLAVIVAEAREGERKRWTEERLAKAMHRLHTHAHLTWPVGASQVGCGYGYVDGVSDCRTFARAILAAMEADR